MDILYLIKIGELTLKKGNRAAFEKQLKFNIKRKLRGTDTLITIRKGRFFLEGSTEDKKRIERTLATTPGIIGYTVAYKVEKNMDAIRRTALSIGNELIETGKGNTFKIESRRADKSFPLTSYEISASTGEFLLDSIAGLTVDVHHPQWKISIEIRDYAYVYGDENKGVGGLPVGSAGKGMLLLSGGIDSPVAGYLMAKRGLRLDAVYFHAYPYTSDEALEKVKTLAERLAVFTGGLNLLVVPFTGFQLLLTKKAREEEITLLMRAGMVVIADILAKERNAGCLITGESLSQVASQTMESISYTGSNTALPVFRPLIGMDKEWIIRTGRTIGTYETSILPFDDCCTIFSPKHPLVKPDRTKLTESFLRLEAQSLLEEAARKSERIYFKHS